MPMPTNDAEPRSINTAAVTKFAFDRSSPKNSDQHDQDDGRMDQAVHHREQGRAEQLRYAPHGRHHGVLERAFPALPGDRLGDEAEHERQVVPEDRRRSSATGSALAALLLADEGDGQRACDGIDQEGELPAPVALDQVDSCVRRRRSCPGVRGPVRSRDGTPSSGMRARPAPSTGAGRLDEGRVSRRAGVAEPDDDQPTDGRDASGRRGGRRPMRACGRWSAASRHLPLASCCGRDRDAYWSYASESLSCVVVRGRSSRSGCRFDHRRHRRPPLRCRRRATGRCRS